jgi:catechol 2,3-dioxygenase-like lactoylglutathione lyase family enzyme
MHEDTKSAIDFPGKARIHIGLAVSNLNDAKRFYQTLLGHAPTKERRGYIKFETTDPSVNLALNEIEHGASLNEKVPVHYGIQVQSSAAVIEAIRRFERAGLDVRVEEKTTCCYSVQDKVWAQDPDGNQWEVFVVTDADAEYAVPSNAACCVGVEQAANVSYCSS